MNSMARRRFVSMDGPPIFLGKFYNAQKFTPVPFFLSQALDFAYTEFTSKEFSQFVLKRCAAQSTLPLIIKLKSPYCALLTVPHIEQKGKSRNCTWRKAGPLT